MSAEIVIRPATPGENDSVHALVQAIADETFAYLFAPSQVPIGEANWLSAWLAVSEAQIVGVTMTRDEWVSDLWVRRDQRGTGIGGELLAHAEREIRSRGHHTLRLRVVKSNTRAVTFYQNRGWKVQREFPHEKFGHPMFEMTKSSGSWRYRERLQNREVALFGRLTSGSADFDEEIKLVRAFALS